MVTRPQARKRTTTVALSFVALFCLATVFLLWLGRPAAADRAVFGGVGSIVAVGLALAVTVIGTGVVMVASLGGLKRPAAAVVLVAWGAIAVLAGGNVFVPEQPADFLIGLLLAGGAIGMGAVLTEMLRRPPSQ